MPRKSPFAIVLSKEERIMLETQVRQYTSPYCDVIRAKIILLAAEGLSNDVIAALPVPRDPDFAAKAGRILDLYDRIWQGRPLTAHEFVISADEKSSIQARRRMHPTLAPASGRSTRVEHEYSMNREPYKSVRRVFWIMDNCFAHRGQKAVARLRSQWPNVLLVHTPVHASWLNQIEIYFCVLVQPDSSDYRNNLKAPCHELTVNHGCALPKTSFNSSVV